ncbi:hypothetical protein [Rurimicrobium arvi]|uniref:Lipoprotein n=1 Tax=Rurimicrobium arvi TaxID=2049916 RepID=A0ABP8MUI1_9BACT
MNRKKSKILGLALVAFVIFGSCKKDDFTSSGKRNLTSKNSDDYSHSINLGTHLRNPYTISVMDSAKAILELSSPTDASKFIVRVTHRYVKFKPQTWDQYDLLVADTSLDLYDYPLDYEVSIGDEYHDPQVPIDSPTYQYAAVPANYTFLSNVPYEILADLYLPEQDPNLFFDGLSNSDLINKLVDKAMMLTGNFDDTIGTEAYTGNNLKTTFDPSGNVQIYDYGFTHPSPAFTNKYIPLEGVKIRARRWFTSRWAYTDAAGNYVIRPGFKRPANYLLVFERKDFDVRKGTFGQATINGPKSNLPWNLFISDRRQCFEGHIFRAAFDYYYDCISGIGRPPIKGFLRPKVKIAAHNKDKAYNAQTHPWVRLLGFYSMIDVWKPDRASAEIYSTTIHELGHAAHWDRNHRKYNACENKVAESWCRGIQYVFTQREYLDRMGLTGFDFWQGWQYLSTSNATDVKHMQDGYTPIVIDLMDTFNQRVYGNSWVDDKVSGFSIQEIWNTLNTAETLDDWRNNLKALGKPGVNPSDLDDLFDYYISI